MCDFLARERSQVDEDGQHCRSQEAGNDGEDLQSSLVPPFEIVGVNKHRDATINPFRDLHTYEKLPHGDNEEKHRCDKYNDLADPVGRTMDRQRRRRHNTIAAGIEVGRCRIRFLSRPPAERHRIEGNL